MDGFSFDLRTSNTSLRYIQVQYSTNAADLNSNAKWYANNKWVFTNHQRTVLMGDDLVGVAFAFPKASNLTPQRYMSADLERIDREETELAESEDDEAEQEPGPVPA